MGHMKDLLITIYGGGDEAVEAAKQIAGLSEIVPHDDEPGWIPVDESKPCHGDTVWVYDGKDVFMGEWWGQSGFRSYGSSCDREGLNSETLLGVTHWMEIDEPEPPA